MPATERPLPAVGEPLLTLRGVTKHFKDKCAVNNIDLTIPRGSIYGFLGPNGAGKTTTIRAIMKILLPDAGEILLHGQPIDSMSRDRIGYLPEERGLYRKMKCVDQLAYLAELKGVARNEAVVRAESWLDRMGLSEYSSRRVDAMSKGMQQKIQFAATFIAKPDVVILDEVFSGLDPLNIELLREMILAEKSVGTTIIFSTHMLVEAEKICDSICLIEGGEVILDGTLEEVRGRYPVKSVRVAWDCGAEPPADLPGLIHREFNEGSWQLTLAEGTPPATLLPALMAAGTLSLFAANRPNLNEIFLTAVAAHRQEASA